MSGRVRRAASAALTTLAPASAALALALVALVAPSPARAEVLDLERTVALALEGNPELRSVEARRGELEAAIREAVGEAFPEVSLVSSWSRSRNPSLLNSPDFAEFLDAFPGGEFVPREQELYRLVLEVEQPIFTWGKIGAGIRLAEQVSKTALARLEAARLDVAVHAAQAFYALLAARSSLATVAIQEEVRREALAVVEARYEIGEATRLELLQSRSALAEVGPLLARSRGQVQVAEQELRVVLGLPRTEPIEVREREAEPPPPPSVETLLEAALAGRPELADLDHQRQALLTQEKVTASEGRPQVDFFGSYGREVRLPENLSDSLYQDWRVALTLRWDFFDGGKRRSQVAQLESQREQLAWLRRDQVNRIVLEIESARTQYESARERWHAAETAAVAAREASRVAGESYEEGVALQTEVLDAQQREILAELERVEAYYDALTQAALLDRAVGRVPSPVPWRERPGAEPAAAEEGES